MSRTNKIILALLGIFGVLCVCGLAGILLVRNFTQDMVVDDPAQAASVARDIVDYDLPRGYQEAGVVNFFVGKMVLISDQTELSGRPGGTMIMLLELPVDESADPEEVRTQMVAGLKRANLSGEYKLEMVGEETISIRGQPVDLLTLEGTDENGRQVRQIFSEPFQGKSGSVMLAVFGNLASWDQRAIDAFIQSIR